jgi:hypothetical protein
VVMTWVSFPFKSLKWVFPAMSSVCNEDSKTELPFASWLGRF